MVFNIYSDRVGSSRCQFDWLNHRFADLSTGCIYQLRAPAWDVSYSDAVEQSWKQNQRGNYVQMFTHLRRRRWCLKRANRFQCFPNKASPKAGTPSPFENEVITEWRTYRSWNKATQEERRRECQIIHEATRVDYNKLLHVHQDCEAQDTDPWCDCQEPSLPEDHEPWEQLETAQSRLQPAGSENSSGTESMDTDDKKIERAEKLNGKLHQNQSDYDQRMLKPVIKPDEIVGWSIVVGFAIKEDGETTNYDLEGKVVINTNDNREEAINNDAPMLQQAASSTDKDYDEQLRALTAEGRRIVAIHPKKDGRTDHPDRQAIEEELRNVDDLIKHQ